MKKLILLIALLAVSSFAVWGSNSYSGSKPTYGYSQYWTLVDCSHGPYKIGNRTYYGYVGLYKNSQGDFLKNFSGGTYCKHNFRN